jgi:hypothetical protein
MGGGGLVKTVGVDLRVRVKGRGVFGTGEEAVLKEPPACLERCFSGQKDQFEQIKRPLSRHFAWKVNIYPWARPPFDRLRD